MPEVGVILLLRKFGSRVYGQQVIGRGLRRVRRRGILDAEQQICAVVDHPKLEHDWLWAIFNSKVRTGVGIDEEFDEEEDLPDPPPRQELDKPWNLIDLPEPAADEDGEFKIPVIAGPNDAPAHLVAEISVTVQERDVIRAVQRARILRRATGQATVSAVIGTAIDDAAQQSAQRNGVLFIAIANLEADD